MFGSPNELKFRPTYANGTLGQDFDLGPDWTELGSVERYLLETDGRTDKGGEEDQVSL